MISRLRAAFNENDAIVAVDIIVAHRYPLHHAVLVGDVPAIYRLIKHGGHDPNEMITDMAWAPLTAKKPRLLHLAAVRGNLNACLVLVKLGADFTRPSGLGPEHPHFWAVVNKKPLCAAFLKECIQQK